MDDVSVVWCLMTYDEAVYTFADYPKVVQDAWWKFIMEFNAKDRVHCDPIPQGTIVIRPANKE